MTTPFVAPILGYRDTENRDYVEVIVGTRDLGRVSITISRKLVGTQAERGLIERILAQRTGLADALEGTL